MTHDELQHHVLGLADHLGLRAFHSTDARRDVGPGFPDLFIAGPGGVLWRELKTPGDRLTPEQTAWRWMLLASGQDWGLWLPLDWDTGRIEAELRRIG